jgi:hypothetical protein
MTMRGMQLVSWLPRILGVGVGLFFGLFAFDAMGRGLSVAGTVVDIAVNLIPAALILTAVAVAWRHPRVGAVAFIGLGAAYALTTQRVDWIAVISGPLFVIGLLFFLTGATAPPRRA